MKKWLITKAEHIRILATTNNGLYCNTWVDGFPLEGYNGDVHSLFPYYTISILKIN